MIEICKEKCTGCTHDGYLCRQYAYLLDGHEKQISKKPILQPFPDIMRQKICHHVLCPNCGNRLYTLAFLGAEQKETYERLNKWNHYCYECGQKLLWEVEDAN